MYERKERKEGMRSGEGEGGATERGLKGGYSCQLGVCVGETKEKRGNR